MVLEREKLASLKAQHDADAKDNFSSKQEVEALEEQLFQLEQEKGHLKQSRDRLSEKT